MLKAENQISTGRLYTVYILVILAVGSLLLRYFILQIYDHEKYKTQAEVNRIRAVPMKAPRGLILDRKGTLIADNFPMYVLTVTPEEQTSLESMFHTIESYTGLDSAGLSENYHSYFLSKYAPVRLAKDLNFSQISALEENRYDLPHIHYQKIPNRYYPSKIRLSHVLGYIKEADRSMVEDKSNDENYEPGDLVGWQGLEKFYEPLLRGRDGVRYYEVDAFGREVGLYQDRPVVEPVPGKNLTLTIDGKLQLKAETLMKGKPGALIVSDPKTGGIYCAVSSPDYPSDLFSGKIGEQEWSGVLSDSMKPLLNRLINGLYPPGSTFKIVTTSLLLKNGSVDTSKKYNCAGFYHFGDRNFHCWNLGGHGEQNLREGFVHSCNIYFFNAIQNEKMDALAEMAEEFGLGKVTGVDLPFESSGMVPNVDYMMEKYGRYGWSTGALLNMAIGQGEVLVTPMQMVQLINMVAMHGKIRKLHFKSDVEPDWVEGPNLSNNVWTLLDQYLFQVVHAPHGTGKHADPGIDSLKVSGKTGTAENPHGEPHAWFVGIARRGEQVRTVVVLVENGGHGGAVAAPIARKILEEAFREPSGTLAKNE